MAAKMFVFCKDNYCIRSSVLAVTQKQRYGRSVGTASRWSSFDLSGEIRVRARPGAPNLLDLHAASESNREIIRTSSVKNSLVFSRNLRAISGTRSTSWVFFELLSRATLEPILFVAARILPFSRGVKPYFLAYGRQPNFLRPQSNSTFRPHTDDTRERGLLKV